MGIKADVIDLARKGKSEFADCHDENQSLQPRHRHRFHPVQCAVPESRGEGAEEEDQMKLKLMPAAEFEAVMERNWTPVKLVGKALPSWMDGIPDTVMAATLASGVCRVGAAHPYSSAKIPSGLLIGGMDVYRHSPDDPVPYNKDWYAVVAQLGDPTMFLVDGPQKGAEHWLESIAERCEGLEILGVPKKNSRTDDAHER